MFQPTPQEVAEKIIKLKAGVNSRPFLVAIDGHGGSGKSTFAKSLAEILDAKIIPVDGFPDKTVSKEIPSFRGLKTFYKVDLVRLTHEVLEPLSNNQATTYTLRDWWSDKDDKQTIEPQNFIIIEGYYSLSPEIVGFMDYKIFIDCKPEECLKRAVARDIANGGKSENASLLWTEVYFPEEQRYVEQNKPQDIAETVVVSSSSHFLITSGSNFSP